MIHAKNSQCVIIDRVDELLTSDNTFAIVIAADVLTERTQKNAEERYQVKWQLVRSLYERKWSKQRIIDLLINKL